MATGLYYSRRIFQNTIDSTLIIDGVNFYLRVLQTKTFLFLMVLTPTYN